MSNVPEIDAIHKGSTGRIYLMGLKEGVSFYTSDNQGINWASPANGLTAVPKEKIESIYEDSADELYIVVEKRGIYRSIDGGLTWQEANGNLPKEPGKNDYDARTLNKFGSKWYAGTKKQGVLTSSDMITWETLKNNQGLTHNDSKDVRDVAVINGDVYIATKLGVWKTSLQGNDPWVQVTGYNGDVRKLLVQNGGENERLYAMAHKDQNILYLSQGELHPFTNKPGSIITDDFRDMTYDSTIGASGGFLVAHKAGLLSIEDDYRAGGSEPETPNSMYADGRYRGTYEDGGYQQVSIEFDLKQDIIENVSWRHLFYKNIDYRTIQEGHNQYPVKEQHDQVLQYLKGKHISIIKDPDNVFLKPGDFITDIDGFSGATVRGTKISSAMRDGLNRGIYHPRGNEIIREIGEYDNGVYRGTFNDGGYQQVSIQFRLVNNVISNLSYRHLFYKNVDYRTIQADHAQYPVKQQHDQILAYLNNKPLETIFDLHNPGSFINNADGFSGATVRANKVLSAMRDGLNREVYNPLSSGGTVNPKVFKSYEDGVYRGTYGDDGVQQVSIQFSLKDNIVSNLSYRWLYYKGNDYRQMKSGDNLYPVVIQHQQILDYLHGKPLEAIYDLHNSKENVMENIDGFSGATVRANKVFSAMMDGLNRGVYGKDTRPFSISGKIDRTAGIKATATVARTSAPDHAGKEVVVFQLMKNGTEPVSIVALEKDINSTEELIAHFNVTGVEYSVRVFVFDSFTSATSIALTNLAAPRTLN